jgi:transposase
MLVVETVAKVRRAYFVQGKAIKAICRELRVSRKVVRKVLRSEATEFRYHRDEQPLRRIGPCQDELDRLLAANEAKPSRERLTLVRMFEELRERGYEGGYDAVRRYARGWQRDRAQSTNAYVPLSFAPGEAYQFDWSHEVVLINGTTVTVKVAHVRLCHSRMLFVRAYPRETQEMVRWTRLVGQFGGWVKLGSGCYQAANFSVPVAQYASSGVRPASAECGRRAL